MPVVDDGHERDDTQRRPQLPGTRSESMNDLLTFASICITVLFSYSYGEWRYWKGVEAGLNKARDIYEAQDNCPVHGRGDKP